MLEHSSLMPLLTVGVSPVIVGVGSFVAGLVGAFVLLRVLNAQAIANAKAEAERITARAQDEAKTTLEKAQLEGERKAMAKKEEFDQANEATRKELQATERSLDKRDAELEKRGSELDALQKAVSGQESAVAKRENAVQTREAELDTIVSEQREKLLKIADMSVDEAKAELFEQVREEYHHEMAKVVHETIEKAEQDAEEKAREITLQAVQRYATEHTSESTVRAIQIPSDDMKGRIIGREGRNIRAIEKATGADIIVDDTPGVIVVSCFDKIRQAVAVDALQKLVADGRMHPSRIEEVVEKSKKEINAQVTKAGKEALLEVNLKGMHPKVVEAMGKLHFRQSYGQNVLRHSVEVAFLCQIIADQLGLDGTIARRCGYLHDIGKAMDHEMEGGHPKIGMDFAKQYGEKEPILNAIGGHHADIPSTSFYTPIVMAADAVSSARPGARRESMERYIQRLNQLQDIALEMKGVTEAYAIQAGREVRVMVDANRIPDDQAQMIAFDIAKKVSEEMTFPGEIKVTVLRETRAIEFAR